MSNSKVLDNKRLKMEEYQIKNKISPYHAMIISATNGGKNILLTYFLLPLLLKYNDYSEIIYISSLKNTREASKLRMMVKYYNQHFHKRTVFTDMKYVEKTIQGLIDYMTKLYDEYHKKKYVDHIKMKEKPEYLWIFDDISSVSDSLNKLIEPYITVSRKHGVSMIFLTQYYSIVKPQIRTNIDTTFIKTGTTRKDYKNLYDLFNLDITLNEFTKLMQVMCADFGSFVYNRSSMKAYYLDKIPDEILKEYEKD